MSDCLLRNFDELVKGRKTPFFVIPAEAGIQSNQVVLDPGVRRGDGLVNFLRSRPFETAPLARSTLYQNFRMRS
jgi:hypothetical protein